jgi:hypothetical protein
MHKEFFVNYNTLLHVSTLLGHLQGETFRCRDSRLHYTVKRECAGDCALRRLWRREFFVVSACTAEYKPRLQRVHASINGAVHSQQHILA